MHREEDENPKKYAALVDTVIDRRVHSISAVWYCQEVTVVISGSAGSHYLIEHLRGRIVVGGPGLKVGTCPRA
jgi:hypothetical protein